MESKVKGPAIGLIVHAVVGILLSIGSVIFAIWTSGSASDYSAEGPAFLYDGTLSIVTNVIGIGVLGFVLWGALKMKSLEGWGMSVAACIVGMIPCGCCLIGLPFGIWGLVVLMKDEVKEAFQG